MAERTTPTDDPIGATQEAPVFARTALAALNALAGATSLSELPNVDLSELDPARDRLGQGVEQVRTRAREMHKAVCDQRIESVGKADPAIAKAREPVTEIALPKGEPSVLIGRSVDAKSGDPAPAGLAVTARTPDGNVVAQTTTDALGGFSLTLEGEFEDLQIEIADDKGAPLAVSSVRLAPGQSSAKIITVTGEFARPIDDEPGNGDKPDGPNDGRPGKGEPGKDDKPDEPGKGKPGRDDEPDGPIGREPVKPRKIDRRRLRRQAAGEDQPP